MSNSHSVITLCPNKLLLPSQSHLLSNNLTHHIHSPCFNYATPPSRCPCILEGRRREARALRVQGQAEKMAQEQGMDLSPVVQELAAIAAA
eukprot:765116-Hanusia_phi.AAC.10